MMNSSPSERAPRIAVATGTRADWGLLSPLCTRLRESGAEVGIIASNLHFIQHTAHEITDDGFNIDVAIHPAGEPPEIAAGVLEGTARALRTLQPDMIVILGDRFEMLATATAATLCRVPIAHIAGGAVSEGAFDDSIRHAITKLATLHLTETEEYRRRVIQMGESPDMVVTTGAIGLSNLLETPLMSREELGESISFPTGRPYLLATMHAATLDPEPPEKYFGRFLDALRHEAPGYGVIVTYPNNDVNPGPLIELIGKFTAENPGCRVCIPSLGRRRYAAALHYASGVVGNSSSGIVEAPSARIPTLDIGIRQRGRTAARSVVHTGTSDEEIRAGLRQILSPESRRLALTTVNPYYRPDTPGLMARTILAHALKPPATKHFHDI